MRRILAIIAILTTLVLLSGCVGVCRHDYGGYDPATQTVVVHNIASTAMRVRVTIEAYACTGKLLGTAVDYGQLIEADETRALKITGVWVAPRYVVSVEWVPPAY